MSKVLKGVEGAMRGYRPQVDWGGEDGPATIKVGGHNVKVGTAGWRRRCLFILLFVLLILSVINFVLTMWLLRKISFNVDGAGNLKVIPGGTILDGTIKMDHGFSVSDIRGQPSKILKISGYHNISMQGIGGNNSLEYGIVFDREGFTSVTKGLSLKDSHGSLLFNCTPQNTFTRAKFFTVTGEEGASFSGSLQTPIIQGDDVHEFRLESRTRSIEASSGELLRIEARDGDVTATSSNDVTLESQKGKFRFESPNVFAPHLPIMDKKIQAISATTQRIETQLPSPEEPNPSALPDSEDPETSTPLVSTQESIQIFQLCVCPSGKLFLTNADSVCIPDDTTC